MKSNWTRFLLASVAAAALAASCTPDGGTIYATIESEVKTTDNSLRNDITIFDLAAAGSGTYYAAAGTIFKGAPSGDALSWTPNASTGDQIYNKTGAIANVMGLSDTALWAGFITGGANLGLHSSAVPPTTTSWTAVADTVVLGKQVTLVQPFGPALFVVCATFSGTSSAYHYELDYFDGASWTGPLVSDLAAPIVGVATDAARFYIASGDKVYYDVSPTGTFATVGLSLAAGDEVTGMLSDAPNGRVFVATKKGGIYYGSLTAWTHVAAPVVGGSSVPFLSIAGPVDGSNDKYLAGSDGYGYYTLSVAGGTLTRFADSTIALYTASVRRILVDGGTVLLGTNGAGLWRTTFDGTGAPGAWTHE